jgi:hypothetical protein
MLVEKFPCVSPLLVCLNFLCVLIACPYPTLQSWDLPQKGAMPLLWRRIVSETNVPKDCIDQVRTCGTLPSFVVLD